VIAMQVSEQDGLDAGKAGRAHELPLGPLAAIDEDPLSPTDEERRWRAPIDRRRGSGGPQEEELKVHDALRSVSRSQAVKKPWVTTCATRVDSLVCPLDPDATLRPRLAHHPQRPIGVGGPPRTSTLIQEDPEIEFRREDLVEASEEGGVVPLI